MQKRPPVVVIMGHVDHGKTTLLDYVRKANVAAREAGGITQSIGAYEIEHNKEKITFIDTPGHEAFANMREHGARVADIAILVVAADDGVKPQTKDALHAIRASKVPFVVAINKIDKSNADINRVKSDLAQEGVLLEGYGGNISWHAISAKTGEGVSDLLDLVLLTAELENFECDRALPARGFVLSCRPDPRRGLVVGVIVKNGTLKRGVTIGTKSSRGKVKILENFLGKTIPELVPSAPALIGGFESAPKIGEEFFTEGDILSLGVLESIVRPGMRATVSKNDSDDETIKVVLKADESASLEALHRMVVQKVPSERLIVLESSIGAIYEGDVKLAESSHGIIVGFRSEPDRAASNLARAQKITMVTSPIIYELDRALEEYVEKATSKKLRTIEILGVFSQVKNREQVVGGRILLGPIKNQELFEVWYDTKMISKGKILNLQSQRKDISEAETGKEVGLFVQIEEPVKVGSKLIFSNLS